MIISGYINECNILDLITIAAFNTVGRTKLVTSKFKNFNFQFNNKSDTNIDMYNYNRLKLRLLINCEFIDFLLFFKQFQLLLLQNNINVIQDFCLQNHINYSELMNIIIIRDEIIQDLTFNMNLNPMAYNHIDILSLLHLPNSLNEAINNIIQIKKCLYEGFKLNIAVYNPKLNKYIIKNTSFEIQINSYLTKNLPILNSGKKFEVNKPPILLFDSSIIKKNPDINNYQFHVANTISILSGYINIDSNF
jgi:hypothetical protein